MIACRVGRLNNFLPSRMYCRQILAFDLKPAVIHMSSSFSFKHYATKVQSWLISMHALGLSNWNSCLRHFVCLPVLKLEYLGRQTHTKPEYAVFLSITSKLWWYLTVMQTALLCVQTIFSFEWPFVAKVLLNGHAVTQNYVFIVIQFDATKNNSNDWMITHVRQTFFMKNIRQLGKKCQLCAIYVWLYGWD